MQAGPTRRILYVLVPFALLFLSPGIALGGQAPKVAPEATCPSCDDLNPCTVDTCDTSTGTCRHDPLNCDDGNPCTTDSCEMPYPGAGGCTHSNLPDGTACDDGNSCTTSDTCTPNPGSASQCVGQIQPAGTTCDDGNSCTADDTCNEVGECAGIPTIPGTSCDDESLCTSDDTCVTATDGSLVCRGPVTDCGDNDLCTQDLCDPATGQCGHPPVNCDDGNSCTNDSCDPATGACVRANLPSGTPCNDGDPCNDHPGPDACVEGNCTGLGPPGLCEDWISCTHDECRLDLGGCIHTPDNSLCPPEGACMSYVCDLTFPGGQPWPLNIPGCRPFSQDNGCTSFSDPCIRHFCSAWECEYEYLDGNPCNDHNACTTNDRCFGGACFGDLLCDDHNPCTTDICDPATSTCEHVPFSCDDGNPCTRDTCWGYGCSHSNACEDDNECTLDSCDPATGACSHQPTAGSCNDHNRCTRGDQCIDGTCQPGRETCDYWECCNDRNDCTVDSCDSSGYCSHQAMVQADCTINPSTLDLGAQGNMVSMTCKLFDVCDPDNPVPISGSTVSNVYVSRADSADTAGDDVTLPDPSTLPCPDPILGYLYERGISEKLVAREVSHANVTFKFNQPADGNCSTLDGDRQDLAAKLAAVPDNTYATVCISGTTVGGNFQACMLMLVRNKGLR